MEQELQTFLPKLKAVLPIPWIEFEPPPQMECSSKKKKTILTFVVVIVVGISLVGSVLFYLNSSSEQIVDGGWSVWGNWTSCDDQTGTRNKTRQCNNPKPLNGGASCDGSSQETLKCQVNGGWSVWENLLGNWSSCDDQTGTKTRTRQCKNPEPLNGGATCYGSSNESVKCPVDGAWSVWGNWASCDYVTGTKERTRQCNNPVSLNGGATCAGISQGSDRCPVNGGWSGWETWPSCDPKTGTKKRNRQCNSPVPLNGGSCAGIPQQSVSCQVCQPGWKTDGSSCFRAFNNGVNWSQARTACRNQNGELASILDYKTNTFVGDLIQTIRSDRMWIGLYKDKGSWHWVDKSNSVFPWRGYPPSGDGACAEIVYENDILAWNDLPCKANRAYVCQKNLINQ